MILLKEYNIKVFVPVWVDDDSDVKEATQRYLGNKWSPLLGEYLKFGEKGCTLIVLE